MKKTYRLKRKAATIGTFAGMLLLFCERLTGAHVHMLIGLLFIAALALHTRTRYHRILKCPAHFKAADIVCMLATLAVLVSGIWIPFAEDKMLPPMLHKLSAVLLFLAVLVHMIQHKSKKNSL